MNMLRMQPRSGVSSQHHSWWVQDPKIPSPNMHLGIECGHGPVILWIYEISIILFFKNPPKVWPKKPEDAWETPKPESSNFQGSISGEPCFRGVSGWNSNHKEAIQESQIPQVLAMWRYEHLGMIVQWSNGRCIFREIYNMIHWSEKMNGCLWELHVKLHTFKLAWWFEVSQNSKNRLHPSSSSVPFYSIRVLGSSVLQRYIYSASPLEVRYALGPSR